MRFGTVNAISHISAHVRTLSGASARSQCGHCGVTATPRSALHHLQRTSNAVVAPNSKTSSLGLPGAALLAKEATRAAVTPDNRASDSDRHVILRHDARTKSIDPTGVTKPDTAIVSMEARLLQSVHRD